MPLFIRKSKLSYFLGTAWFPQRQLCASEKLGAAVLSFELLNEILCLLASLPFLAKFVNVHFSWVMSTPRPCGPLCTANGLNHRGIQLHSILLISNSSGNKKHKTLLSRTLKKKNQCYSYSSLPPLPHPSFFFTVVKKQKKKNPLLLYLLLYFSLFFSLIDCQHFDISTTISHDLCKST